MDNRTHSVDTTDTTTFTTKLNKFLVDDYPNKTSWLKFLSEVSISALTIEEKLACLASIPSTNIKNKKRTQELNNILIADFYESTNKALNECQDANTFIQFTQSRFLVGIKAMCDYHDDLFVNSSEFDDSDSSDLSNSSELDDSDSINLSKGKKIKTLLGKFLVKINTLTLSPCEKIELLLYTSEGASIGSLILSVDLTDDFYHDYFTLIDNIFKSDPTTAPLIWSLIKLQLNGDSVKSLVEGDINNATLLFKLIRKLHRALIPTQEIVDFLQSTKFGELVATLNNPWLTKHYYAFINELNVSVNAVSINDETLGRLYGVRFSSSNENCKKNLELILSLFKEETSAAHILTLLLLEKGHFSLRQSILNASKNGKLYCSIDMQLKILKNLKKRGVSSLNLINYLYAGSMGDNVIASIFRESSDHIGSYKDPEISKFTRFFISLIEEIDLTSTLAYLSASRFFAYIQSLPNDKNYFSPSIEAPQIASYTLFNLQAMNKALEVGANANEIMCNLEIKNDASLNIGHYAFRDALERNDTTNEYIKLLSHLIKLGIPSERVFRLFDINSPQVYQTHWSSLMLWNKENTPNLNKAKVYTDFLISLSELNVSVRQIQSLLSIPSQAYGEQTNPELQHSFCQHLLNYSGKKILGNVTPGQILFSLVQHGLVARTEYSSKLRDCVFAHIKTLDKGDRASAYRDICNPDHPFYPLFWKKPAFFICHATPTLPKAIAEYMKKDFANALTVSEKTETPEKVKDKKHSTEPDNYGPTVGFSR